MGEHEVTSMSNGRLLRELRNCRVLFIHPVDAEAEEFVRLLKRLGCQVTHVWPVPPALSQDSDLVVALIGARSALPPLRDGETEIPTVAIVEDEDPPTMAALLANNVCGVLNRPITRVGAAATLAVAVTTARYLSRLQVKVTKLEDTLRTRRDIEKATRAVMALRQLNEEDAYHFIRKQATEKRVPMSAVAKSILEAAKVFGDMNLVAGAA
jgi:two-component system, response regulator PdtaR